MYRLRRGLGQAISVQALPGQSGGVVANIPTCSAGWWSYFTNAVCWSRAFSDWQAMALEAAPPAPTGAALTVPPASGESAAALVQSLSDQQMAAQQAADASQVQTNALWQVASGVEDTAGVVASFPWSTVGWAALGIVGLFALVAASGGSPRRYGR